VNDFSLMTTSFFNKSGSTLSLYGHGYTTDGSNVQPQGNVVLDQIIGAIWNGAGWNSSTTVLDVLANPATTPVGWACLATNLDSAHRPSYSEYFSAHSLASGAVGIVVDFWVANATGDPSTGDPTNCNNSSDNNDTSYYYEISAPPVPPSHVVSNYIMSDNPNYLAEGNFIRSN